MLAGGVAVGFSAHMVQYPWIAMTLGLLAGLISTIGLTYLQVSKYRDDINNFTHQNPV